MQKQTKPLEWSAGPDFRHIYATQARCLMNLNDAMIEVGYQAPGTPDVAIQVRISQSPAHLKALANLITRTIAEYESVFGEIVMAPIDKEPAEVVNIGGRPRDFEGSDGGPLPSPGGGS